MFVVAVVVVVVVDLFVLFICCGLAAKLFLLNVHADLHFG
jgi:hypothetical protein